MATSGTYDQTVLNTSRIIEHAIRRCGKNPASQTPETLNIAKESLYLRLLALSNDGLNLWVVQRPYLGLFAGQPTYVLPAGTLDVLNVVYSAPTLAIGGETMASQSITTEFEEATSITRLGLLFEGISPSETITLSSSPDGTAWTDFLTLTKTDWEEGVWYWEQLPTPVTNLFFRAVSTTDPVTLLSFSLVTKVSDITMTQWNRDDYMNQPNKYQIGRPSTNYLFEKLIDPQLTIWPVPNNSTDHLSLVTHRQVQDVGSLTQELQVPNRWKEAIIWQLARSLCFSLPDVDPKRAAMVGEEAMSSLLQVEKEETDGAPLRIAPAIRGYTR